MKASTPESLITPKLTIGLVWFPVDKIGPVIDTRLQSGVAVTVGVRVAVVVVVMVGVAVLVAVAVAVDVIVGDAVAVAVAVSVAVAVLVAVAVTVGVMLAVEDGNAIGGGTLITRETRKRSTIASRADARWNMGQV